MGLWDDRILPRLIDHACGQSMFDPAREHATCGLHGTVLELGYGSGPNASLYPPAVDEILAVEPSDLAWDISLKNAPAVPFRRIGLDGARLDLEDHSVDTVLSTFTLCTIPDVKSALNECLRVLRPGGTLHIAEHGLSPDQRIARWQHRLNGTQRRVFGGCHLVRDHTQLLADAGFADIQIKNQYLKSPAPMKPWTYAYMGTAQAPQL